MAGGIFSRGEEEDADGANDEAAPLVVAHGGAEETDDGGYASMMRRRSPQAYETGAGASSPTPSSSPPVSGAPLPGARLTRLNGLALVISLQIGSGIFTAPSQVARFAGGSPGWALACWLLAGALVWTGAASFIELGLRIPRNGGVQEYLRASLGDAAGFLFTWTWVGVAKPGANAAIAGIAAGYIVRGVRMALFDGDDGSSSSAMSLSGGGEAEAEVPWWITKATALSLVAAVTLLDCAGATAGARAANLFLFLKLGALAAIVGLGLAGWLAGAAAGVPQSPLGWFGETPAMRDLSAWQWAGSLATALFGALFSYGGWETIGFVAGDMADPEADLPAVINGAMATVIAGFCLMNAALFVCLPVGVIEASTTVAVDFARRMLGRWAAAVFSVVVAACAAGALNSNVFALARVCAAASRRGYLPAALANLHCAGPKDEVGQLDQVLARTPWAVRRAAVAFVSQTQALRWHQSVPIYALVMNSLVTAFYVMIGNFKELVTLIGLAQYMNFMLSVVGLLILRRRDTPQTNQEAPKYRTWVGNPVIFILVSNLLLVRGVISQPLQGVAIAAVAALGLGVFALKFGLRGFSKPAAT